MTTNIESFGTSPSLRDVETLMLSCGLSRYVIGKSFLGKQMVIYTTENPKSRPTNNSPTMLYISMVHGNEPTGLLSLLSALSKWNSTSTSSSSVVFFPVVNPDAYEINRNMVGGGCRRTNLNINAKCEVQTLAETCPVLVPNGVDINRNFPSDWERGTQQCAYNNPGRYPFSEPETQAVREVVRRFRPTHAMSFHSRRDQYGQQLLIHPYASDRSMYWMDADRQKRYRRWGSELNREDNVYVTGTAKETIQYTASGATMDWFESQSIYTFLIEVTPPSRTRWCENSTSCWEEANVHGETALQWLGIAEREYIPLPTTTYTYALFQVLLLVLVSVCAVAIVIFRKRQRRYCGALLLLCNNGLFRLGKAKETEETELIALNA